jgi:hypothetical protein
MENKKIISSLCYFSVLFVGGIFPLVVYFASDEQEVKVHAKRAFFSHIVPLITIPIAILAAYFGITGNGSAILFFIIPAVLICALLTFIVLIWNIIQGIRVLNLKI